MLQKFQKTKSKKMGEELEELVVENEPVPVQIRRSSRERVTDALILVAIAVAAQVIVQLFM